MQQRGLGRIARVWDKSGSVFPRTRALHEHANETLNGSRSPCFRRRASLVGPSPLLPLLLVLLVLLLLLLPLFPPPTTVSSRRVLSEGEC